MSMLSARLGTLAIACALTAGAATGTLGCKKLLKGRLSPDAGKATTTNPANTPQDDADEQMLDKLDPYIVCVNTVPAPVRRARVRYFSWVDPKKGVTGNERHIFGTFDIPADVVTKCTGGAAKAKAMPPVDAKLDAAGDDYAKAISELDALVDEAVTYYDNKNYKDDKFAKGKAIHPRLMTAFANFSKADNALHATLDGITKPLAQRTLAKIEREDGKKFRWNRKNTLVAARELVEAGDPAGDDDSVDGALYNAMFTAYDQAVTDLQAYGALHKKDLDARTNAAWPLAGSHFDSFSRAADDYRKKAREYMRCLRDAPAKAKTATGKVDPDKLPPCPDGRPHDVVQKYNDFIKISNSSQFP